MRSLFLGEMDISLVTRGIEAGKKTLLFGSVPTVQPQYHALGIQQKTSKFGLALMQLIVSWKRNTRPNEAEHLPN